MGVVSGPAMLTTGQRVGEADGSGVVEGEGVAPSAVGLAAGLAVASALGVDSGAADAEPEPEAASTSRVTQSR